MQALNLLFITPNLFQMQVKVVERQQNIAIQEQEIMRKEKELDSKIRKPAEAEKYRLEKIAEAERLKVRSGRGLGGVI